MHYLYLLQPYGFMESPIPYWHIEDVNVISRWDAGQRFCIRITIPDGSVLLQVSVWVVLKKASMILTTVNCLNFQNHIASFSLCHCHELLNCRSQNDLNGRYSINCKVILYHVLRSSGSCLTLVLILYQRKNTVRSVWSWQINPTLFSVWSATRVSPRTDPFPPIHGGSHTVDWTPCTYTTPVCWRHPDPGVLQPFAHRQSPGGNVRLHRRGVTVDAKQPTSAKHDQDRHSLVRYQPTAASDIADTTTGWLRLRYDSQISAGPRHLPGRGRLHDYTHHQVRIKLFRSFAPDLCYTAISHKTSLVVADRLFGHVTHVTTGLWQRHVSRLTKLHVRQAAVCLERCWTSDLLEMEVRERNSTSSRPSLVRVPQRVEYKLSVLVYRCLHNLAPECLCDELRRVADISSRQGLRSSSTSALIVPPTRLSTVSDRAFPTAASRIWNSLPLHVTSAPLLQTEEEAEAVSVQPQFPILICCTL